MRKTMSAIALAVVLMVTTIAAPAAVASTNPTPASGPTMTADVALRWCTWGSGGRCYPRLDAVVPTGTTVNAVCWTKGANVTGAYKTNHWIFVAYGMVKGWVHSSWVANSGLHVQVSGGPEELSSCRATRADILAPNYAMQFIDRGKMPKTFALSLFPAEEWGYDGTRSLVGQLSGNSAKLTYWGYRAIGKDIPGSGKPIDIFNQNYSSAASTSGTAPIGALMFWSAAQGNGNQGLVGISVGGGKVFIAQGKRTPGPKSNRHANVVDATKVDSGVYLGWVTP
ncbi:hypothetical protein [Microbacterium sp. NPDC089188]|uniref:hypothetical protein n=1 Tax=Microbacterium sp. NPDC089188 TaxID=3154971 RepID=UPI00342858BD